MSAHSTADNSKVNSKPMSPSTSSGPKPLHLPLASVVGSSNSPSTPDFSSLAADADPSASVHGSQTQSEKSITLNSPTGSSPLSPSISGLRKQSSNSNFRRQSSISYISSPPSYSPSTPQFAFNSKRHSVDAAASATLVRSPLSSVHPSFAFVDTLDLSREGFGGGAGLGRSNSLGGRAGRSASSRSPRSPNIGERSSTGSVVSSQHARHLKERPPATLAEKHAELLHFIAQKESKCLELRSQLAMHEAELLQLKRKWERIVNRGFEKTLSPNSSNTNTSSVYPSNPYASTSTPSSLPLSASPTLTSSLASPFSPNSSTSTSSTSPPSSSYFPTLSLNAPHSASSAAQGVAHGAVVLEGIKESVQGMSRFIAAGLESIVHVGPPTPAVVSEAESGHHHTAPLPLMLGSGVGVNVGSISGSGSGSITTTTMMTATTTAPSFTAANIKNIKKSKRQSYLGHEQKESQSSSSTSTSASTSTFTSTSTSTSVTSATSVTSSLRSGLSTLSSGSGSGTSTTKDGGGESTAPDAHADDEDDAEDDFGDFETGQAPPQAALAFHSRSSSSPSLKDEQEQVLMVRDTGATPTMSPNPAFEKRMRREGRKEKDRVKVERLVLSPGFAVNDKDRERQQQQRGDGDEFGWDDDAWGDSLSSSVSSTGTSRSQSRPQPQRNQQNQQRQQQQQHRTQDPSKSSNSNSNSSTRPKSPLAPMSSMPGLSMGMNMNMNTPTAQQVSSWVGSVGTSVGKKWGEIAKGGSTFVKNQKRASLLLSDMQQSIVSALGSPVAISNSSSNPNSATKASSPLQTPYTPASQRAATTPTSASTSTSLLDDSDDESYGESSRRAIVPVMVPDSLTGPSGLKLEASAAPLAAALKTPQVVVKQTTVRTGTKEDEDEDEWNW